jgi:hypothetical protein
MTFKPSRLLLACMVLMFSAGQAVAKSDAVDNGYYTPKDKEFYLTSDEIFFIRPGLDAEIVEFKLPADLKPEVTFTLKDPGGLALDVDGVTTPGPIEMRYYLTFVGEDGQKDIFEWGNRDRDGDLTNMGNGKYRYKFDNALPSDYDMDATYTFALRARRDLREWDLDRYVVNEIYDFVPSGASEPMPRQVVTTETCNGRCHDPLAMHGGGYVEVDMCTQCHNPNYMATRGEEARDHARMDVLIHAIHSSDEVHYPTEINDCQVCHTGGTPTENFPLVASPNPVPVCDGSGKGVTTLSWDFPKRYEIRMGTADGKLFASGKGEGSAETGKWTRDMLEFFVVDPATGETIQQLGVDNTTFGCLGNAPFSAYGEPAAMHTNWLDHPSRLVCGSCHSYIDWETGEGHSDLNFPIDNDEVCAGCHKPYAGREFDRTIMGAHMPFLSSSQFPGLIFELVEITNTDPGKRPIVKFKLYSKNGMVDLDQLTRLRLSIWGPNEDWDGGDSYGDYQEEAVGNSTLVGNTYTFQFERALPDDAMGSYSLGVEGRDEVEIVVGVGETEEDHDTLESLVFPFAVTDDTAMPRRMVVDDANCEACHANLALHGNNRRNANYCITCHRPERLDIAEPAENVSFKWMIHKIHRGADLENGYTVVRSRGTYVFDDIHFPGDLRNCEKCHVNDSYMLPLPSGLLDTLTPNQFWSPTGPTSAACLSCHDSYDAQAHAYSNTTFFGESCATCHGEGAGYDVEKVHAR